MSAIWKYEFDPMQPGRYAQSVPQGAMPLSASACGEKLALWMAVSPDASRETRWFSVYWTGEKVKSADKYLGTGVFANGLLVAHLFEE